MNIEADIVKIIDKLVYLKIVRYNPNNQNIGIAITTDIIAGKKLKSLNKISTSNLKKKASQVHKIHNAKSENIAIIRFE